MQFSARPMGLVILAFAAPSLAQTVPVEPSAPSAGVAEANQHSADHAQQQTNMNAQEQARYEEDRAAYLTALRSHNHNARVDARIYDHQQRAYADAMYAWRVQVEDCRRGHRAACDAPAPDPAHYW